ncbi:hypothetical protein Q3G72_007024 [Acer saccharum]|nr:hypothetical protein Q3G72_007024 [Acer saccharum]
MNQLPCLGRHTGAERSLMLTYRIQLLKETTTDQWQESQFDTFFDHVELEPEPEELDLQGMTDRDLRLKDKEMGLLMKLDDDELRAARDREQADRDRMSEDDEAFNNWERNRAVNDLEWPPVNFMLKDLSP